MRFGFSVVLFVLIAALPKVLTNDNGGGECRSALGMEEGRIPDHAITASSSYETKSVGPQNARLRQEINGGAWCPKAQISSEVKEYLEVDLQKNHLITWTETQGRFGNGQGQEYAEAFLVEYWRPSLSRWVMYKDSRGQKVLTGNSNTYLVVRQRLELPFVASKVRFIPYSEHPRTVCMRVELYGCSWEQSIVKYDAPRGEIRDLDVDLTDVSYDGILYENLMRNGLGQLVDGLFGDDDYQKQLEGEKSGSRWIGWNNETREGEPVDITFEFDGLYEFSSVQIHANNMFTRGVQVFSAAEACFSFDGVQYQTTPVWVSITKDYSRESAENITIDLRGRVARFVQLRFFFSNKWILISEISFRTVRLPQNVSADVYENYLQSEVPISTAAPGLESGETTHTRKEITPATSPTSNTQAYIGLITGVLAMVIILLACTVFLMVRRGRKKVALLHKHTALVSSSTKPGVTINMKDLKMNMSTPIINNGLSRSRLSVKSSKVNTLGTTESRKNGKKGGATRYGHVTGGEESDSENSSVYHEPYKLLPNNKPEYGCLLKKNGITSSKSGEYTDFTSVNSFPEEIKFTSPSFYNLTLPRPPTSRAPAYDVQNFPIPTKTSNGSIPSAVAENFYAATDIIQVHLCEADGLPDFNGGSSFHKKQLVIVKSLWRGCKEVERHEFLRETSWLAGLRDPNLARVVGLCTQDEPMCALLEHSECRELPHFLAQKTQDSSVNEGQHPISYGGLIYIATQIASGMKYLETLDLVHRDLAARNCVIDKAYTVKVSDHAMYCNRYDIDYYISDTKVKLPIRWMAWESLLLGKYTTKSDVWSFAVTLWEILMACMQQPFAEFTNEQVVENSNHWYQNHGCQRYLPRPPSCPREIYDLMGECWKRNAVDRPHFSEIHLFLQRKNLGYNPMHTHV
ncbi:discoidin domain-containing receptor 2-like [Agrilus planipennis]|uniref:Discoidin domain-containing receptor 2-like n=1 Tax=Agrilus planipennis TaxID=224129 RepID=A0A7F5RAP1_AGRPL|nr:discoidin domain-containing receptor 2-like [Agrilus planipennis]